MLGALDAILGHRSAHSLATGPFTVEPVFQRGREREGGRDIKEAESLTAARIHLSFHLCC